MVCESDASLLQLSCLFILRSKWNSPWSLQVGTSAWREHHPKNKVVCLESKSTWWQSKHVQIVQGIAVCKGNSSDFIADNIAAQNCFHLLNFPHVIRKLTWVHFLFTSSGASAPRCLTSSASALRKWRRGGSTKWESTGSPGWPLISRPSKQHSTPVSPPPTASSQPHDRRTLLTSKRVTYIY